jgi:hypothetical protein
MESLAEHPTTTVSIVKVVQPARQEASVVRHVHEDATVDEIKASMCSCVVHLCGCN